MGESRRDLRRHDRDERHRGACADQAELAQASPGERANEGSQRGDVNRADPGADVLETRRQVATRAEEESLDGSEAQPELVGDLRVRKALPLPQEDAAALALGKVRKPVS